ncbi:EthD family reductase [Methylogaea oryzae]|uniref:EthD domain-containing protein n=1 Tax=Methylogaea oryzae TaxID=1295382 RepID=A0A8D4VSF7_9GAMM|nr:EthD family reductase [Methylogaea oryzae]BBL72459.1 hypothetical protein MoryE10_30650 [Methylogaea oryzae]
MIKVSMLYPNKEGGRFDVDYYLGHHVPLSVSRFGAALKGYSVEQGINAGLSGSRPPYLFASHLLFDSLEAFHAAFEPHAEELMLDMHNYTDIEMLVQISEVKVSG